MHQEPCQIIGYSDNIKKSIVFIKEVDRTDVQQSVGRERCLCRLEIGWNQIAHGRHYGIPWRAEKIRLIS